MIDRNIETGQSVAAILSRDPASSAPSDLDALHARLAHLKATPEDAEVRALRLRAELLWSETRGEERQRLDFALANLELALNSGTPSLIQRALRELQIVCHALDHGQQW